MTEFIEVYGIRIDSACAALLAVAMENEHFLERRAAIRKLGEMGCNTALGIVANRAKDRDERELALKLIGR